MIETVALKDSYNVIVNPVKSSLLPTNFHYKNCKGLPGKGANDENPLFFIKFRYILGRRFLE